MRLLRFLAGAVALLTLAAPVAVAAEDDPAPTAWPTIAKPATSESGTSDPQPETRPTVARPEQGSDEDPTPPTWPVPTPG